MFEKEAEEYLTQFYCLKQCDDIAIRECKNGERIRCDCFEVRLNCLTSFAEQVTKELEKENAELRYKFEHRNCLDCSNHSSKLRMKTLELEKECTKAKELIERLLKTSCNSDVLNLLPNCSEVLRVRAEAEQFIK